MARHALRRYVAPAALLTLVLAGCSDSDPADPTPAPTSPSASTAATPPTETATPTPSEPAPSTAAGGSSDQPEALEATTSTIDWKPVPGSVRRTVTRSTTTAGDWSLSVAEDGSSAVLAGPDGRSSGVATSGRRVSDALLDDTYAVVVLQDKAEVRPAIARVTDLETGETTTIDGRSDLPTTNGGTWALQGGQVVHATYADGAYCLASVDLASAESTLGWCAPKRHGFNGAQITPTGTSMLTFDDSQPACRTVAAADGAQIRPFPGVPDCKGWDGLLTEDGAVWSTIPKEQQIDSADFYARVGDAYFDLGPGASGTLEWCAGASYFVRNPQRDGDPAALMRWTPDDGLVVVYESPAGQAFLDRPRCGGNALTITAFAQKGDEQVTTRLP